MIYEGVRLYYIILITDNIIKKNVKKSTLFFHITGTQVYFK